MTKWTIEADSNTIATIEINFPVLFWPERTCFMRYDAVHCDYVCSSCGEFFDAPAYDARDEDDALVYRDFRFCPHCGARVLPAEEGGAR